MSTSSALSSLNGVPATTIVTHAIQHFSGRKYFQYELLVDELYRRETNPDPYSSQPREASEALLSAQSNILRRCWSKGWQPVDVVAAVHKFDTQQHADLLAWAVVQDFKRFALQPIHPRWRAQLEELLPWWSARDIATASQITYAARKCKCDVRDAINAMVQSHFRLATLPALPLLLPPPGPGADASTSAAFAKRDLTVDAKALQRVRAMLAKAESTEFPDEAEVFTQKAQELMTRFAIDVAMLSARSMSENPGLGKFDAPAGHRIHIEPPYVDAKASLMHVVAQANRCRALLTSDFGFVTVFGFHADLEIVELLYTSLLSQATAAMVQAEKQLHRNRAASTKSFRISFQYSYAARIGERLEEAAKASTDEAARSLGSSMELVLANREQQVHDAVRTMFPKVKAKTKVISDDDGWTAGRTAADGASLGTAKRI